MSTIRDEWNEWKAQVLPGSTESEMLRSHASFYAGYAASQRHLEEVACNGQGRDEQKALMTTRLDELRLYMADRIAGKAVTP